MDVGFLYHGHERLLRGPARLQKRREIAALAQLRDVQADGACPSIPLARPVTIALVLPLGASLTMPRAAHGGHLDIHQPLRGVLDQLTQKNPCHRSWRSHPEGRSWSRSSCSPSLSSVVEQPQTTKKRGGRQYGRALRYAKRLRARPPTPPGGALPALNSCEGRKSSLVFNHNANEVRYAKTGLGFCPSRMCALPGSVDRYLCKVWRTGTALAGGCEGAPATPGGKHPGLSGRNTRACLEPSLHGLASLSRVMEDGRSQMIGLLHPGDFLGHPGRQTHTFHGRCHNGCGALRLPIQSIRQAARQGAATPLAPHGSRGKMTSMPPESGCFCSAEVRAREDLQLFSSTLPTARAVAHDGTASP